MDKNYQGYILDCNILSENIYRQAFDSITMEINDLKYLVEADWGDQYKAKGKLFIIVSFPLEESPLLRETINNEMGQCLSDLQIKAKKLLDPVLPSNDNSLLSDDFEGVFNKVREEVQREFRRCLESAPSFNSVFKDYGRFISIDLVLIQDILA
ncbi:hypothetical protein [Clostridium chromiireducens]|uniref:Uncharacterized protein n=1 Tax=Clostridium chromiireducens TaxID=225345 RepID=A0A1V4IDH5_9CLOT|nr:hypothetical protein [Clostridium chromiireducens]OPJ57969.1 hypothetical protein CLCHR_41560 [Clostridium chromiireducens]RII34004.1 hypothetical protein D2A34_12525 [Clostridium chromiireducens]